MTTLDHTLDLIDQLPKPQQEMLLEILRLRHAEETRKEIARDAKASLAMFESGELKPQSAQAVIEALRHSAQTKTDAS
jgi:hypothetical protein